MILTGENGSTWRKPYPSGTLSTTNPTCSGLQRNPGFGSETPATNMAPAGNSIWTEIITQLMACHLYVSGVFVSEVLTAVNTHNVGYDNARANRDLRLPPRC
jgi:hypothetical protein